MDKKKIVIIIISIIIVIVGIIGINLFVLNNVDNSNNLSNQNAYMNTNVNNLANSNNEENTVMNNDNKDKGQTSVVYMTTDITSESLMKIYDELGVTLNGKVAVKVSTGEAGGNNYLKGDLIGDLVKKLNGTIVECNTAYGGSRSSSEVHKQTAREHGFYDIADVDILDEEGTASLKVENGKHLKENLVGSHYSNYDSVLVLSHFKGHAMAGFGGAIKNISIGFASSSGKSLIHSAGTRTSGFGGASQDDFLESMAEAAKTIQDDRGNQIVYINVMNRLSIDCDCDSNPAEPDMHDIGILASTDPIALDKACVDLVYTAQDGQSLINRIESRNGIHTLDYGAQIGLGNLKYELVNIDARNN